MNCWIRSIAGAAAVIALLLGGCDFTEADAQQEVQAAMHADPHAVELDAAGEKKVTALLHKMEGDADVQAFMEASMQQGRAVAAHMERTTDTSEAGRANRQFLEEVQTKKPEELTPDDVERVQLITGVRTQDVLRSEQMQLMRVVMARYPDLMTVSDEERQALFLRLFQKYQESGAIRVE